MIVRRLLATAVCAALLPLTAGTAAAQEEEAPMVYGVYLQCNPAMGARLAEIISQDWAPIVQAHIDAGDLTAWGHLAHNSGGGWNRAIYHVGTDRARMLTAMDEMVAEWAEANPESLSEFWAACSDHEDYIWTRVTGSAAAGQLAVSRPAMGMSTYWVCDEGRGALADLLVEQVFAPVYDAQVEAGLLNSWAWLSHFVGGKYRRLLVMDGADAEALLTARDNILETMVDEHASLTREFSNVCNGHTDYLWNIVESGP